MFKAVIGAVLLLFVLCSASWWFSPALAKRILDDRLERLGGSLLDFQMARPDLHGIRVWKMTATVGGMQFDLDEVWLQPLSTTGLQVSALGARLTMLPDRTEPSTPGVNLTGVLEMLAAVTPVLPAFGHVQLFQVCLATCDLAELWWKNTGAGIEANLTFDLLGQVRVVAARERISLQVVGFEFPLLADGLLIMDEGQFLARFKAAVRPGLRLQGELVDLESQFDWKLAALRISTELTIPGDVMLSPAMRSSLRGEALLEVESLATLATPWAHLQSDENINLGLRFSPQGIEAALERDWSVDLQRATPAVNGVGSLPAKSVCTLDWDVTRLGCKARGAQLAGEYGAYRLAVNAEDFDVDLALGFSVPADRQPLSWHVQTMAQAELNHGEVAFAGGRFHAEANQDLLEASSTELVLLGLATEVSATHQLGQGKGSLLIDVKDDIGKLPLASLPIPEIALDKGDLTLKASLSWESGALFQQGTLSLENVIAEMDGYRVSGGAMDAVFEGWPDIRGRTELSLSKLDVGIPMTGAEAALDFKIQPLDGLAVIEAGEFSVAALGGRLNASEINFDLTAGDGGLSLTVEQVALNQLLALERDDFDSSGVLSGSFPVQIREGKVSISGGKLSADLPGGYIRYRPDDSVRSFALDNQGLKLVLDAMEDFHYHTLDAAVTYTEAGKLFAATSLKGSNPGYEAGREIHLNLNLEENLNTLLKSLRLGSGIADRLGKKAKTGGLR